MSPRAYTVSISLVILLVGVFISCNKVSAQICKVDAGDVVSQCERYVRKSGSQIAPSQQCCKLVRTADVPCVCRFVSKDYENTISMEKAIYVARYCGVEMIPGTKCGSYVVPKGSKE